MGELEAKVSDRVVEVEGRKFLSISNTRELGIKKTDEFNGVIIYAKDIEFAKQAVRRIRSHFNPKIYLQPILLYKIGSKRDPFLNQVADGIIYSMNQIKFVLQDVDEINLKISELNFGKSVSFEAQIIEKTLQLMYTRKMDELEPFPYAFSGINYTFPILSANFQYREEKSVLDILKIAEEEHLLEGEFYDRIYLCPSCTTGHLSYREVCPKCGSANNDSEDVIHHFPCGFVDSIKKFENELDDQLDCPKCNKRLRHIGVDYDKPSVMHNCKNCEHRFQDLFVNAKCMNCTNDTSVTTLPEEEIKKYFITKKGIDAAINGYISTNKDIESIIGTVPFGTFKTMLKYEIERLKQTEGQSNIVGLNILNASQVYSKVGTQAHQTLLKDLVRVIRNSIRSSDVISFKSSSVILISMNEIPLRISKRIVEEIVQMLEELIQDNFKDLKIDLGYEVIELDFKLSHELQIQQLIKDFR